MREECGMVLGKNAEKHQRQPKDSRVWKNRKTGVCSRREAWARSSV